MTETKPSKPVKRSKPVDMSAAAIDQRLRDLSQLFRLGMMIRQAKYLGPVDLPAKTRKLSDGRVADVV